MVRLSVHTRADYEDAKTRLIETGALYEDSDFPAQWSSLFYSNANSDVEIVWKRPHELVEKPCMFIEGPSRWGIVQGAIGNCWFVSALGSISCYPKLIDRIFPNKQNFEKDYCGMFYFRFWQFGQWVTIVVDDRLPVVRKTNILFFISSTKKEEFWSSILEKAYAKFYGCYENLHGGRPSSGLLDLTGGITEWYKIVNKQGPKSFFKRILKYQNSNCILSCGIMSPGSGFEEKLKGNLLAKHAYSITDIKVVGLFIKGKGIVQHELLRIKNPWGGVEWEGAWSKKSPQWKNIPETKRLSLGLKVDEDGEFWMSYQDFEKNFTDVYICTVEPQMLGRKSDPAVRWHSVSYLGEWNTELPKSTDFLNPANIKFWLFSQFKVELSYVDLYDTDKRCELVVALMQRSQRYHRQKSIPMLVMGYYIFRLQKENEHLPLNERWFKHNKYFVRSRYADSQEITCRFKLNAGLYVVIPITSGHTKGEFLLRMCYEKRGNIWGHIILADPELTGHAALQEDGWNTSIIPKIYVKDDHRESLYSLVPYGHDIHTFASEPMPAAIPTQHTELAKKIKYEDYWQSVRLSPPKMLGTLQVLRFGTSCSEHLKQRLSLRRQETNKKRWASMKPNNTNTGNEDNCFTCRIHHPDKLMFPHISPRRRRE